MGEWHALSLEMIFSGCWALLCTSKLCVLCVLCVQTTDSTDTMLRRAFAADYVDDVAIVEQRKRLRRQARLKAKRRVAIN